MPFDSLPPTPRHGWSALRRSRLRQEAALRIEETHPDHIRTGLNGLFPQGAERAWVRYSSRAGGGRQAGGLALCLALALLRDEHGADVAISRTRCTQRVTAMTRPVASKSPSPMCEYFRKSRIGEYALL